MEEYENKIHKIDRLDDTRSEYSIESNSEFGLQKYQNKILDTKIIHTKSSESSSDSKNNLNTIEFESIVNNKVTSYFNIEKLSSLSFNDIYEILLSVSYLIFVDNKKLTNKKKCFFKKSLLNTEFPGCTFFPYELADNIKKNIIILNTNILKDSTKIYGINFDDNMIMKNCLYRKMEIIDTIIFIPIDKYNIKLTEYKIRGFCQIAEELGAKCIDITFKSNNIKKIDTKIGSDIEIIAMNLGLSINKSINSNENYQYSLTYPYTNIQLNEYTIKSKIKNKKFIISETVYNSNLELQYLLYSRCKYQINKYSTTFAIDNTNIIDYNILIKLKSHGIKIGLNYMNNKMNTNYISVVTNVLFSSSDEIKDIICGNNVSLNEIGFNILINSIKKSDDFTINGIYKIMVFIDHYIETILKNKSSYKIINNIMKKIKSVLTLSEYAELLCNHFSPSSQWIHLKNFIDILSNKTPCYDKLGYIIIICHTNITNDDKIDLMIRYIQQKCIELKIEDKFWHMLQPFNIRLKNELKNKILYNYNFIQYYNWYNLNIFIESIKSYTINFTTMDDNSHLLALIQNMNSGYKYWEFYTNVVPFIVRHAHKLILKDDMNLINIFEKSLTIESFITSKIMSSDNLTEYIEKKINRIKNVFNFINSIENITTKKLYDLIKQNDYVNKKIHKILGHKIENLKEWIDLPNDTIYSVVNKIICYNEKLNINNIPSNYLGYMLVYNNYINGVKSKEFESIKQFITYHISDKSVLELVLKHINFDHFNNNCSSYYDLFIYLKTIMEDNKIDISNIVTDFII